MAKPLLMNEVRTRAARFSINWRDSAGDERQDAQSFVRDLLQIYGVTETRAAFYEKRVKRTSTGARGYIDALVPGVALIEMKSAGKDLVEAERQALDYIDDLPDTEVPDWVVTCDFRRFRVLELKADDEVAIHEFPLEELAANVDRMAFFGNHQVRQFSSAEQELASVKAAQTMASLWEELDGSGYDDHEASVFMVRTLFALYADDAGMWSRDLFLEFLATRTAEDGSDLGSQITFLYQQMARPIEGRQRNLDELIAQFPYVNGGLFEHPLSIPQFDSSMRQRLLDACLFNWSAISPAIFGSLFQAIKDKEARRGLGEHYTTETNIMKVIEPMFLDELRRRFEDSYRNTSGLRRLRKDMGEMRFLDPACGCGNFLVIAYREMRALDLQVLVRLQELGSKGHEATLMFDEADLVVRLENFHGIELEEWPAQIARTALHLVEHQANQAMELALGEGPPTLPLDKTDTILQRNALTTDWSAAVGPTEHLYVLGNPPFLGHATRNEQQAAELRSAWKRDDIGRLDYVTGWYAKSLDLFSKPGYAGEFAFVSTNSITQGEPVPALFSPVFAAGWRIKFAHRTFAWTSEAPGAAAVHCTIVGFDKHPRKPAVLFEYDDPKGEPRPLPVAERINGYLVDGPNVLVEQSHSILSPELPPMVFGNMPRDGSNLVVEPDAYEDVIADPVAAKYVRRYVGARELIHGEPRWCLWLTDLDPLDLGRSAILKRRVEGVREFRLKSTAESTRAMAETPHLFGQRAHVDVPHLVVPRVSSENRRYLPCGHFDGDMISSDSNFTAEDADGFAFGVISSSAFLVWQKSVGGRLKSDLRFSNTLTWNTFPLPAIKESARAAIIAGGHAVLEARALHPGRSLAAHYDSLAMTPELLRAHRFLDAAVDKALDVKEPDFLGRQAALFASYSRLIQQRTLALPHGRASRRRA